MGGTVRRQQKEQDRKRTSGIEQIEMHIPSPKTTSCLQYVSHLEYMFQHMDALFGFYGFEAARIKWLNYVASQRSIEEAVNILLNGSKKYNSKRRKKNKQQQEKEEKERWRE